MPDDERVVIYTVAYVPAKIGKAWLQHLRDFDTANPGCHFEVIQDAPDASFAEMIEALRVNPGLTLQAVLARQRVGACPYWPGCGCGTQSGPHTCEWQATHRK